MPNILITTAHPDDELIWFGSTLYELSKFENINIYCICFWGLLEPPGSMRNVTPGYKDIDRKDQFYEVSKAMNFKNSWIITETKHEVIQQNRQKDEVIEEEFKNALKNINLDEKDISLLITHSYYGDERKHPHHIRMYDFFSNYTLHNNVPFSFFSILKIPDINHNSILKYTLRKNQLHLLSLEKIDNSSLNIKNKPAFCLEFQGNLYKKLEMLKLYKSVDFKKHYNDYYAFSTVSERLYFNTIASKIIENILNNMSLIVKDII